MQPMSRSDETERQLAAQGVNESINRLVMRLAVRAETLPESIAHASFVSIRDVTDGLLRLDHQVIYGRRGTGKTHAFRNLESVVDKQNDLPIYIDLRTVGSSGGLYGDTTLSRTIRGTQLLIDVLDAVHSRMLAAAIEDERFEGLLPHLDAIAEAASRVRVEGSYSETTEDSSSAEEDKESALDAELNVRTGWPTAKLRGKRGKTAVRKVATKTVRNRTGSEVPRILFGRLNGALQVALSSIAPVRIWILLDEWSSIPTDLQPILADLLRRGVFPVRGITVKIGAIERRTKFTERSEGNSDILGIELGSDTAAAINLDEHLTESVDRRRFFSELIFRHLQAMLQDDHGKRLRFPVAQDLVKVMFHANGLEEFVRASEGVPRDAIQIASLSAQQARHRPISVSDIHSAARKFYLQDKEAAIAGNTAAEATWRKLIRDIVEHQRSRAFLVRRDRINVSNGLLDLHDARLIHLMKPGLHTKKEPGQMFDGYCLDFGSYVTILEEAELMRVYSANGRIWNISDGESLLSDNFDRELIFSPPTPSRKK